MPLVDHLKIYMYRTSLICNTINVTQGNEAKEIQ